MQALTDNTIKDFAAAVRAELADLPKREIQDLTDGLEADLQDRFSEEGPGFDLGSAAEYAAELREAAGVAPKNTKRPYFSMEALNEGFTEWITHSGFGRAIYDFLFAVRPVWWVLRAGIAYLMIELLTRSAASLWLLPVLMLISVQWGRKKWLTQKFFTAILLPLNVLALVLSVPTASIINSKVDEYYAMQSALGNQPSIDGLRLQGSSVTEIKAYDETGTEVTGLTFKDEKGNQLLPSELTPGAIKVPDVTGLSIAELQQVLTDAGINNVDFNRLDNGLDSEVHVVSTMPAAGAWMLSTDVLTVIVGKQDF
jgi:hypothetical protein